MTVLQEPTNMSKYSWLSYVEFLDMLCRIAIVGITQADTLDYKTHSLLQLIYASLHKSGVLAKGEYPLQAVDEILR